MEENMNEPRYEIRNGEFWYIWEKYHDERLIGPTLSFYIDFNMGEPIVLRYGSTELVEKYHLITAKKMAKVPNDVFDPAKTRVITFGTDIDIEEVNKVIQITGYISRFMEKYNL
jgi:hypothetical protein